jgi:hypothetical protein
MVEEVLRNSNRRAVKYFGSVDHQTLIYIMAGEL